MQRIRAPGRGDTLPLLSSEALVITPHNLETASSERVNEGHREWGTLSGSVLALRDDTKSRR